MNNVKREALIRGMTAGELRLVGNLIGHLLNQESAGEPLSAISHVWESIKGADPASLYGFQSLPKVHTLLNEVFPDTTLIDWNTRGVTRIHDSAKLRRLRQQIEGVSASLDLLFRWEDKETETITVETFPSILNLVLIPARALFFRRWAVPGSAKPQIQILFRTGGTQDNCLGQIANASGNHIALIDMDSTWSSAVLDRSPLPYRQAEYGFLFRKREHKDLVTIAEKLREGEVDIADELLRVLATKPLLLLEDPPGRFGHERVTAAVNSILARWPHNKGHRTFAPTFRHLYRMAEQDPASVAYTQDFDPDHGTLAHLTKKECGFIPARRLGHGLQFLLSAETPLLYGIYHRKQEGTRDPLSESAREFIACVRTICNPWAEDAVSDPTRTPGQFVKMLKEELRLRYECAGDPKNARLVHSLLV